MAFGAELADFVNGFGMGQKLMGGTREEREDRRLDREDKKANREYRQTQRKALEENIETSKYNRNAGLRQAEDFGKYVGGRDNTSGAPATTEGALPDPDPVKAAPYTNAAGETVEGTVTPPRQEFNASKLQADASVPQSIKWLADQVGASPQEVATVMSYETGGTFDPSIRGGAGNRHIGVIQFGPEEQKRYGASQDQTFAEQMPAVAAYLKDRGFKPGMGLLDLYSTINAGSPGRYNASDAGNGGAPGSVRDKVEQQMAGHAKRAQQMFAAVDNGSGGALPVGGNELMPRQQAGDPGLALGYAPPERAPGGNYGSALNTSDGPIKPTRNTSADPDANNFVKAFSHIKDALKYGIKRDGAVPSGAIADGSEAEGATKYASGYGAAPPSLVQQAEAKIDPDGTMSESERKMRALQTVSDYYRDKGDVQKANEATYSMIQYYRQVAQRYGAFAQVAAQNGDMDAAASAAIKAYANIPDGKDLKIVKDGENYAFEFTDLTTGKTMSQGIMTPQQMGAMAMKVSPADFDRFIMSSGGGASGRGRSTGGATGGSEEFQAARAAMLEGDNLPARAPKGGMSTKEYADYLKEYDATKKARAVEARAAAPKAPKKTADKVPTSKEIEEDAAAVGQAMMDLPEDVLATVDKDTSDQFTSTASDLYTNPANRKNRMTASEAVKVPFAMTKVDPKKPAAMPFKVALIDGDEDNVSVTVAGRAKPVVMSKDTFTGLANRWKASSEEATAKLGKQAKTAETESGLLDTMGRSAGNIADRIFTGAKMSWDEAGQDIQRSQNRRGIPSQGPVQSHMDPADRARSDNRTLMNDANRMAGGVPVDPGQTVEGDNARAATPSPELLARYQQLSRQAESEMSRRGGLPPASIATFLERAYLPKEYWPPALIKALAGTQKP